MKVFAIITAALMAAGGSAYYMHSGSNGCPLAKSGGCCPTVATATPVCCTTPCPACTSDCLTCCDACEVCCNAGVQSSVSTKAKPDCCGGATKVAVKAHCCVPDADCCVSACCFGAGEAIAKPVAAEEECCSLCTSPARVGTSAAVAGVRVK